MFICCVFVFKQKTAYEMRISDWSSDVCSSDLSADGIAAPSFRSVLRAVAADVFAHRSLVLGKRLREHMLAAAVADRHEKQCVTVGRMRDRLQLMRADHRDRRRRQAVAGVGVVGRVGEQVGLAQVARVRARSEEHTSELQSLMRISYAVFCLTKKTTAMEHLT